MWGYYNNPMGWFGFGWIFMVLFCGLVIWGIIVFIRWLANQGESENKKSNAIEILKERYAKGEINKDEFEEKKKNLTQ
jgi:putative membrane protein